MRSPLPALLGLLLLGTASGLGTACGRTEAFGPDPAPLPDSGPTIQCTRAADCPGTGPVCEDARKCPCGTSRVCNGGTCGQIAVDCLDGGFAPDTGPKGECSTADDCPTQSVDGRLCFAPTASPSSCLLQSCAIDCLGPRTCEFDSNDCLVCVGANGTKTTACAACEGFVRGGRAQVENIACDPGVAPPFMRGAVLDFQASQCEFTLTSRAMNVGKGSFLQGGQQRLSLTTGDECLGTGLPTGRLRFSFACARCTFVLGVN